MKSRFSLILIILPLLICLNACRKEGVNLNFPKKEKLKSNARIIVEANWNTSKEYLSVFNISKKDDFYNIFHIPVGSASNNSSFVVAPDNKSVFISTKEVIFQVDSANGSIIKK